MIHGNRFLAPILVLMTIFLIAGMNPAAAKTTLKDEIEIGQEVSKDIEKEFPLTDNKDWLADIDRMGKMLTPNVNRKDIPYSFKIIKEKYDGKDELDAFSLPGGPVYFSEKMWRILTPNERLGVLAHEIAHVDKRHAIDTISEMQRRDLWATAILIISGAKSNWWDAADIANTLYTLKYSRKREREADMMAVDFLTATGQSPAGLVTTMKKLLRIEKEEDISTIKILSTHPETEDRIKYLTERCIELGIKPDDMELKFKEQPDRLGDVVSKEKAGMLVTVSTVQPLTVNQLVWIKKPLWDEDQGIMIPKPIAKGVSLDAGNKARISVKMEDGFDFVDIEAGDGVYPRESDPSPTPPKEKSPALDTEAK